MTAHNPALPHLRRSLARQVLRDGTALALPVDGTLAVEAEWDARQLARQHRGRLRALWQTDPLCGESKVAS